MGSEPILMSGQVELQTLIFGWYMYDQLWTILQDTGLVFLPFIAMIINNFLQPITATYTTSAAQLSLKKVEWDLIRMLIVIVLAGQPFMGIALSNYRQLDLCKRDVNGNVIDLQTLRQQAQEAQAIAAGRQIAPTAYPGSQGAREAKVPLWWYAVMSVATGFTEAAKASVPCVNDFRQILSDALSTSSITGTDSINAEIQSFINECYRPAKIAYDALRDPRLTTVADPLRSYAASIIGAIEAAGGTLATDVARSGSVLLLGLGARSGDGSGDGWPTESDAAASKLADYGNERFYDRLVWINNWKSDGQRSRVSCRQWWGLGGDGGIADPGNIATNTGIRHFYNLARLVLGRVSIGSSASIEYFDEDSPHRGKPDPTYMDAPAVVMRQLGFRIWVLLAVRTGVVEYTTRRAVSITPSRRRFNVTQGNYEDLALDNVLEAIGTTLGTTFTVRRRREGQQSWLLSDVENLLNNSEQARGVHYVMGQIQTYIRENVTPGIAVDEAPGGGDGTEFTERLRRGIGTFGLTIAAIGTYMTAYVARKSFPYMQALLLCGIYLFLGVGLVFSGYTLEYMYAGAMAIFTLKFMAFIFYICAWLDNNLIVLVTGDTIVAAITASMTGGGPGWTFSSLLLGSLTSPMSAVYGALRGLYDNVELLMVDYATAGLYFTLPALFATVMAWAGVRGAEVISQMQEAQKPLTQAGAQGGQMVQKMAAGVVSGGVGMAAGGAGGAALGVATGIGPKAGFLRGTGLGKYQK